MSEPTHQELFAKAEHLRKVTNSILSLPTLPTIAAKLIEVVDNPKTSAKMLGELISDDQVLTAKLLKMCNSAYYGLKHEVTTVNMAIVILGFESVKEVTLSVSVLNYFKRAKAETSFDLSSFWEHSASVGMAAKIIAQRLYPSGANEAFLGGLLHDLGKVVLVQYMPKDFDVILAKASESGRLLFDEEQRYFGVHHGVIGFWLGKKWKLPDAVSQIMRHHHHPWYAPMHKELVASVYLANILCQQCELGSSGNNKAPEVEEQFWDFAHDINLGIEEIDLEFFKEEILEEIERSSSFIGELIN
ncbi:MAG: HDOD domain-containing protein [Fibrobacterales bacterium]